MAVATALGAYVPTDWDKEGGGVVDAVATLLRALGYENVFCSPPPARVRATISSIFSLVDLPIFTRSSTGIPETVVYLVTGTIVSP